MTTGVVEVGPGAVRGPCEVDEDLVSTALECIDDETALFDEQPVQVDALWRAVFRAVLPNGVDTAVVVCPTWWASNRVERVQDAAATVAQHVVLRRRADVFADDLGGDATVVEIAPDFVAAWRSGSVVVTVPRLGDPADVAQSVVDAVAATTSMVLLDSPAGVDGARPLACDISERFRATAVSVSSRHCDHVLAGERDEPARWVREPGADRPAGRRTALLAAVVVAVLVGIGIADSNAIGRQTNSLATSDLIEGRLTMKVPAQWTVRRVTSGPGSARLEVSAPDRVTAVLVTQSEMFDGEGLSETAAALRRALDEQQAGVFSDFNPEDRRAGRAAVTYREVRDDRQIDWAVFVDGAVRIAIGCQSAPDAEQTVREVCDAAIGSAHRIL